MSVVGHRHGHVALAELTRLLQEAGFQRIEPLETRRKGMLFLRAS